MTRLLCLGPSLLRAVRGLLVLCAVTMSMQHASLLGTGVAQAAKRGAKKPIKRGKPGKPQRTPRGTPRKGGIAALPPLRSGTGEATSVMLATSLPAGRTAPSPPGTVPAALGKGPVGPTPQAALPVKGGPSGTTLKRKKGPPTDEELMEEAQAAYVRGDRGKAIELALVVAEKSNERSPAAWKFIGLAACSVRSHRLATRAYQGVKTPYDQRAIADACKFNGLSYKGDQFVGE